ncbi:MAG: leucine-rich repeat domain-containing protein [Clostridia bacterium]|nr:leucine-rich repeat domain-containing protein [Clostridia bacterium]
MANQPKTETPTSAFRFETAEGGYAIKQYVGKEKSVVLPSLYQGKPITEIGMEAFSEHTTLTEITVPASVTNISWFAFSGCTALKSICVAEDNPAYLSIDGNLYTKDGKTLLRYAIGKTEERFALPKGVTKIGDSALSGASLTEVLLPHGLTEIEDWAFLGCESLTALALPDTLKAIGEAAFEDCDSLTELILPNSLTELGDYMCESCDSLRRVVLPKALTKLNNGAFSDCDSLTEVLLPATLIEIGDHAFEHCEALTAITLPESLVKIGWSAFASCTSLTAPVLPDALTEIGGYAFLECNSLTQMVIPASVSLIGEAAFLSCENLKRLIFANPNGWYVTDNSFESLLTPKGERIDLTASAQSARYFTEAYCEGHYWYKK